MIPSEPRPAARLLSEMRIQQVVDEAFETLETVGVWVENAEAVSVLGDLGAAVADDGRRVRIPRSVTERALASVPGRFTLFDRDCQAETPVGDDTTAFVPGSAAVSIYDFDQQKVRKPRTADVIDFVRVSDRLSVFALQSTGIVPADIPESVADRYRLFLALMFGRKPVVTGTFVKEGFAAMLAMLAAVRGGAAALRDKPMAVFDCCPSPPLSWSDLTAQALMDCARHGIPAEIVSMPLPGATAPVTLSGSIVQHTAETMSGIVIHQAAGPGAPVVYGGAPACFDMRTGTTPLGAVETMLMDVAYIEVARKLGIPSHAYMGLSDAKTPDYQAGMESAMGATLAVLAGVHVMAGPGMLDFVNCQSLEKLVLDAEVCQTLRRLRTGVAFRERTAGFEVLNELAGRKDFLTSEHTRRFFREEVYYPSSVIDRASLGDWESGGGLSASQRAHAEALRLRGATQEDVLPAPVSDELEALMLAEVRRAGADGLPDWRAGIQASVD